MSNLENIVQEAADYAEHRGHTYVTVEHITMFLLRSEKVQKLLKDFKIDSSNIPKGMHINANNIETPDSVNATGYPSSNAEQMRTSNSKGTISILFSLID